MSKGLGKVERRILEAMPSNGNEPEWRNLKSLKTRVWGEQKNHVAGGRIFTLRYWQDHQANHHFTFRRALDRLTAKGLLEMRMEIMWLRQNRQARREYRITQAGKCAVSKVHTYATRSKNAMREGGL